MTVVESIGAPFCVHLKPHGYNSRLLGFGWLGECAWHGANGGKKFNLNLEDLASWVTPVV